jgi:hypothetical protein
MFLCGRKLNFKFYIDGFQASHIRWVPCHNGMARPKVLDGGDGLQISRVAAYILYKQSRTADKALCSSFGVGRGANNFSV